MINWIAPHPIPFKRLQIRDGVQLNLDKWNLVHDYYHQRQNYYYQSLYQAGIVEGLGVKILTDNTIEIQPGLALDYQGNVIIISQKQALTINFTKTNKTSSILLITIQYKEQKIDSNLLQSSYQIELKTTPLKENEIELCRLKLDPNNQQLKQSKNPEDPGEMELDLTHRITAKPRNQATLYLGISQDQNTPKLENNFLSLLQSLENFYPGWEGAKNIEKIPFITFNSQNIRNYVQSGLNYDLIYLTYQQFQTITSGQNFKTVLSFLKYYLENGGVLLVESLTDPPDSKLSKFAEILNNPLQPLETSINHPLWSKPFLFQKLPEIQDQKLSLSVGGGIILAIGNLASAWGCNSGLSLPQETIQTFQELGINILHFAWYRKHLTQLQTQIL